MASEMEHVHNKSDSVENRRVDAALDVSPQAARVVEEQEIGFNPGTGLGKYALYE